MPPDALRVLVLAVAVAVGGPAGAGSAPATGPGPGERALARFAQAWADVHTYRCRVIEHEVKGSQVQDRVYRLAFSRPHDVLMQIVQGDGRGGVAVWHGGSRVEGHRGGLLSFVHLNLDIHNPLATTLRGTTIAQADFGALLDHLRHLQREGAALGVGRQDGRTTLVAKPDDPAADGGVTRETLVLGANHLPVEYEQQIDGRTVRRVRYRDVRTNVDVPPSTFEL